MAELSQIMLVVLIFGFPLFAIWCARRYTLARTLGPIVLCFAVGILIRNLNLLDIEEKVAERCRDGAILLAIPMLLYSSDVGSWLRTARPMLQGFGLQIVSVCIACTLGVLVFSGVLSEIDIAGGMLIGIYVGGTPNLFAVGLALDADSESITLLNSAEIFWGALYLLFLLSASQKVYSYLLMSPKRDDRYQLDQAQPISEIRPREALIGVVLTLLLVASTVGISMLLFGSVSPSFIVLTITSLAVILSLVPAIRGLKGTYEIGDFLLLAFGVAAGLMSDFEVLLSEGAQYILFVLLVMLLSLLIHLLLCKWAGLDHDIFILTSTAGFYGPVFVPQVIQSLGRKSLLVGAMAVSLIGLVTGTYIGVMMAQLFRWLI